MLMNTVTNSVTKYANAAELDAALGSATPEALKSVMSGATVKVGGTSFTVDWMKVFKGDGTESWNKSSVSRLQQGNKFMRAISNFFAGLAEYCTKRQQKMEASLERYEKAPSTAAQSVNSLKNNSSPSEIASTKLHCAQYRFVAGLWDDKSRAHSEVLSAVLTDVIDHPVISHRQTQQSVRPTRLELPVAEELKALTKPEVKMLTNKGLKQQSVRRMFLELPVAEELKALTKPEVKMLTDKELKFLDEGYMTSADAVALARARKTLRAYPISTESKPGLLDTMTALRASIEVYMAVIVEESLTFTNELRTIEGNDGVMRETSIMVVDSALQRLLDASDRLAACTEVLDKARLHIESTKKWEGKRAQIKEAIIFVRDIIEEASTEGKIGGGYLARLAPKAIPAAWSADPVRTRSSEQP